MPDSALTNSRIVARYRERTPASARLAERAQAVFPSGIVHDVRRTEPYSIYVERAQGSRKWDADGNEYVDYYGGHGALILGHGHPAVVAAVQRQMALGTQYAACHELEVRWGELVKEMVPCAERVRFTASGTEANLLALRLARAYTGRPKIVRFLGHFHGWLDHMAFGVTNHFDGTPTPGVLAGIAENVILVSPHDRDAVRRVLESRDDIAAVVLEPTGASWGMVPMARDFVTELRLIAGRQGIVLIFDEVVTGFRVGPGGAQAELGVIPDLTSLAKIVAGGLPGGAVCGRKEILDLLDFDATKALGVEKIPHQGTFNANPLSAAAGIAALELVAKGEVCARANAQGAKLRQSLNAVFEDEGVHWSAYGTYSGFYIYTNPENRPLRPSAFDAHALETRAIQAAASRPVINKLRLALMVNGVDVSNKAGGSTSAAHTDEDIALTAQAFRKAVRMLKDEGDIPA